MKKIAWIVFMVMFCMALGVGYSDITYVGQMQTVAWPAVNISGGTVSYEVNLEISGQPDFFYQEVVIPQVDINVPSGGQVDILVRVKFDNGSTIEYGAYERSSIVGSPDSFFLLAAVPSVTEMWIVE